MDPDDNLLNASKLLDRYRFGAIPVVSSGQVVGIITTVDLIRILIQKLQSALDNIQVLETLVPICAWCKKIRDDEGYWNQLESYIESNLGASFSHGICPECKEKVTRKFKAEE